VKISKHIRLSVSPEAAKAWDAVTEFVAAYHALQHATNGHAKAARQRAERATHDLVNGYEYAVQAHTEASERGKVLGAEGEAKLAEFMADGELNVMRES
jgi:hypothetical protein